MGFSATLRLPSTSCYNTCNLVRKQQRLTLLSSGNRRPRSLLCIRSVASRRKRGLDSNGAAEPTRNLLERLFVQTQKLEKKMSKDSHLPGDFQIKLHLETLETDLQAALTALKLKEEDLQQAEIKVLLEHGELKRAKEGLQRREEVITEALSRQEKLEEELKMANSTLASTAREMEELKLLVKEKEQEIAATKSAFSLKEEEMGKMGNELVRKNEEALRKETELKSKVQILNQANAVIVKQEVEIQELRAAIAEKEDELKASLTLRMVDEGKLKEAEAKLEKQATEWVLAQQELKKLAEEASKHENESNQTLEDFRRVKILLGDIRSELITSQKSLASSRSKMEEHEKLLDEQLTEVEKQKQSIMSYMTSLKDAQIEVETEKVKVRVAEARNKELERDLSLEKELMNVLQLELMKEKSFLQQAIDENCCLQAELDVKNTEFAVTQESLRAKESELVEARLDIQHLKSEQAALILILEERDVELSNARKKLEELNSEVKELKALLVTREKQLDQATGMLKEKDKHVQSMQHELQDTKLKFAEAESVVERITELTSKLVISIKDDDYSVLNPSETDEKWLLEQTSDSRWKRKQLEAEMGLTRQSLREKEMELLEAQRTMVVKDEELKTALNKLEQREKEIERLKQEMTDDSSDLRKMYELAQERVGEKTMGDHAIEKLQLEAAQVEVEAATAALQKLTEMSRELITKTNSNCDSDSEVVLWFRPDSGQSGECFSEVKMEVARLSALSEQLVREAGISVGSD